METAFVDTKIAAAKERLVRAGEQLGTAIRAGREGGSKVDTLEGAAESLKGAELYIDEIRQQIDADVADLPAMRDCPACGRAIRAAATLCGYCWTKL
jgi:hypothetical protein